MSAARIFLGGLSAALLFTLATGARAEGKPMKLAIHPAPLGTKPVTFRVKLGAAADKLKGNGAALVKFEGVEVGADKTLIVRVFVATPDASIATSQDDKRYLGNLTVVAAGATAKGKKKNSVNAQLELTPEAKAAAVAAGELAVTLIPTDINGKEPAEAEFSIKKITLDVN